VTRNIFSLIFFFSLWTSLCRSEFIVQAETCINVSLPFAYVHKGLQTCKFAKNEPKLKAFVETGCLYRKTVFLCDLSYSARRDSWTLLGIQSNL